MAFIRDPALLSGNTTAVQHDLLKSQTQSFVNDKLTQVMLHCALIAYIFISFLETSWISRNANPFYKNYVDKNQKWFLYFFNSIECLHFDFLSGDGGATTWTKFMCSLSYFFYRWIVTGRLSVGTVYNFKVLFPPANLNNETSFL